MTPETLRLWVRRDEVDHGQRLDITSAERERTHDLEREVRELRRANRSSRQPQLFSCVSSARAGHRGEVHPRAPGPLESRADLPRVAGCSEQLLCGYQAASLGPPATGRG